MEIGEIISDALHYPLGHVKELGIYIGIMFIMALIFGLTIGSISVLSADAVAAAGAIGILGIVLILIIGLLVAGYGLDIVKFGIERSDDAPSIDIGSQVVMGIKFLIVSFIYVLIPSIVMAILGAINDTLGLIVGFILFIIFGLALYMGVCRLAKTGSLGDALNIPEAVQDIMSIGIIKLLAVLIIVGLIGVILNGIANLFTNLGTIGIIISAILTALVGAYIFFFQNRAIGLLYGDA